MTLPDVVVPCARIVEQGDPDRFRTVMAAPVSARAVLFPLYALNVEVARAPWVTQEAMIAEMRLQWWSDALEEIADSNAVRKHEVTTPLASVLTPVMARRLDEAVAARRWDVYRDPFEDEAHFDRYLDQTAGHLMWTAAEALGAPADQEDAVRSVAAAGALVAFLRAVPKLEEAGRIPLVDGTHEGVAALARRIRMRLTPPRLPAGARAALWPALGSSQILKQIERTPGIVADGAIPAPLAPWRLSVAALTGRAML
ncbi:squalene/phytoene synthase family protein [Tateyamaria sp. ANG-S1]|uniref:squalene/phytoene synthase family protein n=1 Tax=Tateyamaria sp. ANG-S1 TaxID=1577905 RepID=UPI00057DB7E5|nr:squalene/phytoene synthase family protein [Tateyamaria sp. ANG-S1]KIC48591.1 phytoene synthase [Tateyamaria sp. ANG-S1]